MVLKPTALTHHGRCLGMRRRTQRCPVQDRWFDHRQCSTCVAEHHRPFGMLDLQRCADWNGRFQGELRTVATEVYREAPTHIASVASIRRAAVAWINRKGVTHGIPSFVRFDRAVARPMPAVYRLGRVLRSRTRRSGA